MVGRFRSGLVVCGVFACASGVHAVGFYSTFGAFDSARTTAGHTAAGFEDFEEAVVAPGGGVLFDDSLDATTNNAVFSTGQIVANLRVQSNKQGAGGTFADPRGPQGLGAFGAGFQGASSKNVAAAQTADSLDVLFTDAQNASVAVDLVRYIGTGSVRVYVFDHANLLIDQTTVASVGGAGSFLGIVGSSIGRINLYSANGFEGVDNVHMYNAAPVPEPFTMLLGAAALGAAARRRRRRA